MNTARHSFTRLAALGSRRFSSRPPIQDAPLSKALCSPSTSSDNSPAEINSDCISNAPPQELSVGSGVIPADNSLIKKQQFEATLTKLKNEVSCQKTSSQTFPTPYSHDGDKNEYSADKELGPCVEDWELGPLHPLINREMPGQKLYKAEPEDIEILSQSKWKYSDLRENPMGMVYRLVRVNSEVTSPIGRMCANGKSGLRVYDKWRVMLIGYALGACSLMLGLWQLRRSKWKHDLIEYRRNRTASPITVLDEGPMPWVADLQGWEYRPVQLRGVLDTASSILVGPQEVNDSYASVGFNIVQLLRLVDGTCVLVDRGHVSVHRLKQMQLSETPQWVTIKGFVHPGIKPGGARFIQRVSDRVMAPGNDIDHRVVGFLEPDKIAACLNVMDVDAVGKAVVQIQDIFYDEDIGKLPEKRKTRFSGYYMHKPEQFYDFWVSEHWHLNYAFQWMLGGLLAIGVSSLRFINARRWKF